MPHWISVLLEGGGLWGAIVFVLLTVITGLVAYIKTLHTKADKVYGYRLAERDTLNKTLSDTAKVLGDMLRVTEDRNELTEEQAKLIEKQAQAFELLKVTIIAQYDTIKDHNQASAMAVGAMADAIRQLSAMVVENRTIAQGHVQAVNSAIGELSLALRNTIQASSQAQINEMRNLLGLVTIVARKPRKVTGK